MHTHTQIPSLVLLRFHITATEQRALAPVQEPAQVIELWANEPKDLSELLDNYIVENKVPAGAAGAMLYLTKAETRSGERVDLIAEQKHKLFLVAWLRSHAGW